VRPKADQKPNLKDVFYLSHMKYEGSIGFVTGFFFIADFHVLGLFMAKNMI
jgi:hypothetical protein